jgi:hypothetical protein
MKVSSFSSDDFIARGGRIPAPIHSFKNWKRDSKESQLLTKHNFSQKN